MKKIYFIIALLSSFLKTSAYRFEHGNNITISQPVMEDLYIAGGTITINAPIHGDLIIAGGTIIINDTVTNDILSAGGNININGYVGDDIRCAGGNIRISKNVIGDVVITAGSINIDKGVNIGSLVASGGNVIIDGNINGEIKGVFGDVSLNGNITKDIDCRSQKITLNGNINGKSILAANYIIVGDNATFNNDVRYWNNKGSLNFKQSIKNGHAIFDPSLKLLNKKWYYLGATSILGVLWYLGTALLMLLIIQYLFSNSFIKASNAVATRTLKSLLYGFLFFIAVPVASVIVMITIIGIPIGLLLLFSYIILVLLTTVISSLVYANWLSNRYNKKWSYGQLTITAFGIFILLKLVSLIFFIGWLLTLLVICIAYGGILLNVNWKKNKKAALASGQVTH